MAAPHPVAEPRAAQGRVVRPPAAKAALAATAGKVAKAARAEPPRSGAPQRSKEALSPRRGLLSFLSFISEPGFLFMNQANRRLVRPRTGEGLRSPSLRRATKAVVW